MEHSITVHSTVDSGAHELDRNMRQKSKEALTWRTVFYNCPRNRQQYFFGIVAIFCLLCFSVNGKKVKVVYSS